MALRVSGGRPVWAGHRCAGVGEAGHGGTRRFFTRALEHGPSPTEVITDKAAVYPPVLEELTPDAWHHTEPYANNRIESDHS